MSDLTSGPKNYEKRCASIPNLASVDWEREGIVEKQQPEFSLLHSNILFAFSSAGEAISVSLTVGSNVCKM